MGYTATIFVSLSKSDIQEVNTIDDDYSLLCQAKKAPLTVSVAAL